jgi:hypothetical protein
MRQAIRREVFAVKALEKALGYVKLLSPSFVGFLLALAVFAYRLSAR